MEIKEAIASRHAVRSYLDKQISADIKEKIDTEINSLNKEHGLHIQPVYDEEKAFGGLMAHYGHFVGVKNYLALIGKKEDGTIEKLGYCGEDLVLLAQSLGLNSCFVGLTYKKVKQAYEIAKGEKLFGVISLGYGATQGVPHKSKAAEAVSNLSSSSPSWFKAGVETALLAPTALNQQKFYLEEKDGKVVANAGHGSFVEMDLGIVKKNFEIGSGKDGSIWMK